MSQLLTDDELHEIDELVYLNDNEGDTNTMAELNYKVPPLLAHIAAQADEIAALQSDIELLIKVSCREQRYKCEDAVSAQNAPCPDVADVLQKWNDARASKPDAFDHHAAQMRACAAHFSTPEAIKANDEEGNE